MSELTDEQQRIIQDATSAAATANAVQALFQPTGGGMAPPAGGSSLPCDEGGWAEARLSEVFGFVVKSQTVWSLFTGAAASLLGLVVTFLVGM